jgi:stage II sporulation protein AA (anti-sigma F factor antagonist)
MLIELDHQDDVCILRLKGRLVSGTDPDYLRAKAAEIKSHSCNKVLADLRELLFIGSTGIGFLVGIYTSVTKSPGGRFVLVAPSRRVREVLDITRLSTVIPLVSDIASGLDALRGEGSAARSAGKG